VDTYYTFTVFTLENLQIQNEYSLSNRNNIGIFFQICGIKNSGGDWFQYPKGK